MEKDVMALVRRVFDEFCACDCDQFGLKVFYDFIEDYNFRERNLGNSVTFIAKSGDVAAGMIELRDFNHVCLLFVDKHFQNKGIAGRLFDAACRLAIREGSRCIDVNASLYSMKVYEKLGFVKTDEVKEANGIKYLPMINNLHSKFSDERILK
jgi:GNAT superfamily N-acetyltransferase